MATRSLRGTRPGRGPRQQVTVLAVPALVWYLVFLIGPLGAVFFYSVTNASTIVAPAQVIGFRNFERVLTDDLFWIAARQTLIHVGVTVPVMVLLGFMLGYYLFLRPPGSRVLRVLFFTSALLSVSTKSMIFYAILAPKGLVNQVLGGLGLEVLTHNWLADPATTLGVIIAVDLWSGIGFLAILFSAQLTSVSSETIEASRIDGCGHWRSMWHVAFGTIRGFVGVIAMVQFLWTLFLSAGTVLLLTKGGPGTSSFTLSFLVWAKAFEQSDIGYSQAVGVLLFLVGVVGAVIIRSTLRGRT